MPIKVLHLITELNIGGAEKSLARLLAHLDGNKFDPMVVCLYGGDGPVANEIRALNVPVIDVKMTAKWRWDAFWRVFSLLRCEHPDILHTWMFHANIPGRILGKLAGTPIIISSERTMGQEGRLRRWLNWLTAPLATQMVCNSKQVADFVVQKIGISQSKTVVIPNGIKLNNDDHWPARQQIRKKLDLLSDQILLGTVARLHAVKRLDVFLKALSMQKNTVALLVGDGPEQKNLQKICEQLKITGRVFFVGQQKNVQPWLAAIDIFVLTSDWEGLPNAVLEAMAAKLPVVATAVGGTPEVVVDGATGLLVPPGSPVALAEAITKLLNNPHLRRQMGQAGFERVSEHFTVQQMVDRTETLYRELITDKLNLRFEQELQ